MATTAVMTIMDKSRMLNSLKAHDLTLVTVLCCSALIDQNFSR